MVDQNDEPTETSEDEPTGSSAATGTAAETDLDSLKRERDDMFDRLLRKTAEFDNYRKRIDKERREQSEWAAADVLSDGVAG